MHESYPTSLVEYVPPGWPFRFEAEPVLRDCPRRVSRPVARYRTAAAISRSISAGEMPVQQWPRPGP